MHVEQVSRVTVQGLLPEGLKVSNEPSDQIPIFFVFNDITDLSFDLFGYYLPAWLGGITPYHEFMIGVPNVNVDPSVHPGINPHQRFFYMPILVLDNRAATFVGQNFYNLNKHFTSNVTMDNSFDETFVQIADPLQRAEIRYRSDLNVTHDFLESFNEVAQMMNQPTIGAVGQSIMCSEMKLDIKNPYRIFPASSVWGVNLFVNGHLFPKSVSSDPLSGTQNNLMGSYFLETSFTLSEPLDCRQF